METVHPYQPVTDRFSLFSLAGKLDYDCTGNFTNDELAIACKAARLRHFYSVIVHPSQVAMARSFLSSGTVKTTANVNNRGDLFTKTMVALMAIKAGAQEIDWEFDMKNARWTDPSNPHDLPTTGDHCFDSVGMQDEVNAIEMLAKKSPTVAFNVCVDMNVTTVEKLSVLSLLGDNRSINAVKVMIETCHLNSIGNELEYAKRAIRLKQAENCTTKITVGTELCNLSCVTKMFDCGVVRLSTTSAPAIIVEAIKAGYHV